MVFSLASLVAAAPSFGGPTREWTKVGEGILGGISGCALATHAADRTEFLAVHDNKKAGEPRLAWITVTGAKTEAKELAWPAGKEEPVDLESVSAVPGKAGEFVALASAGRLFHVAVANGSVTLLGDPIDMPRPERPEKPNYEGFTLQVLGGSLVAVWADRGDGAAPATLFWGPFDLSTGATLEDHATVSVPFPPAATTRDVSDLFLDTCGVLWGAAASDPGDDGPFESAVYVLGTLRKTEKKGFRFQPNPALTRVRSFARKVEALALVHGAEGGTAFGSDDENLGGAFLFDD